MLIIGWGDRCNTLGEIGPIDCPNCGNNRFWLVVETSKRLNVYFIPVAKWQRRYFCACPICRCAIELAGREEAQALLLAALESGEQARLAKAIAAEASERSE